MLEIISEWSVIYFKVGAILGFGIGALAQVIAGTSRDWTLSTCLALTIAWPLIFHYVARGLRND